MGRIIAIIILSVYAAVALSLAGCADKPLTNRVACTTGGDEAVFVSWWNFLGIAAKIDERDRATLCKKG